METYKELLKPVQVDIDGIEAAFITDGKLAIRFDKSVSIEDKQALYYQALNTIGHTTTPPELPVTKKKQR